MYRKLLSIAFVVVLIITSSFGFNVMAENITTYNGKISFQLVEAMETIQSSESISVCIWFEDINHQLVEERIYENIGISKSDLNTGLEMPTSEILDYYNKLSNNCAIDDFMISDYNINEYLIDTQKERIIEKNKVDDYIIEKLKISRELIKEKYDEILDYTSIDEANVLFKSRYSPMIIVDCKKDEIYDIAQNKIVESMCYFEPYEGEVYPPSMSVYKYLNGFNRAYDATGLTGLGVELGIIDHGHPEISEDIDGSKVELVGGDSVISDHATGVLNLFIGEDGLTENINKIYCASLVDQSCPDGTSFYYGIEHLIEKGVKLISSSIDIGGRYYLNEDGSAYLCDIYTTQEKWLDYITYNYDITYLQAAGNGAVKDDELPDKILNLGLSYNCITVGAMNDKNTKEINDDVVALGSAYENYTSVDGNIVYGCFKPDFIISENVGGRGTSTSTPVIASIVALMFELKPSLEVRPQTNKAILMASCHRKAKSPNSEIQEENMSEGLTYRQGAGIVDVYKALSIVGNTQYGERTIESYMEEDSFRIIQPKYSSNNLNVSISWFYQDIDMFSNAYPNPLVNAGVNDNLDMTVYDRTSGNYIGGSANVNSSTEMAYVPLLFNINDYEVIIGKDLPNYHDLTYGYAWSTDNMEFVDSGEEGIFFINNKRSRHYLCADENNSLIQNDHGNIQWVIRKEGDYYTIRNGTKTGGIGKGNNINTNIYEGTLTEDNLNITIDLNDNGTFSFKSIVNNKDSYLQAVDGSYLLGAKMCWNEQVSNDSSEWYFEKINYKKGDVDMNGVIDTDDVMLFVEAFNTDLDLTENQEYLADVNNDGVANSADIGVLNELIE